MNRKLTKSPREWPTGGTPPAAWNRLNVTNKPTAKINSFCHGRKFRLTHQADKSDHASRTQLTIGSSLHAALRGDEPPAGRPEAGSGGGVTLREFGTSAPWPAV